MFSGFASVGVGRICDRRQGASDLSLCFTGGDSADWLVHSRDLLAIDVDALAQGNGEAAGGRARARPPFAAHRACRLASLPDGVERLLVNELVVLGYRR